MLRGDDWVGNISFEQKGFIGIIFGSIGIIQGAA